MDELATECDRELLPCPFCAGVAQRLEADDGGLFIECTRCGASSPLHYDRCENLIPNWNRREGEAAAHAEERECRLSLVEAGDRILELISRCSDQLSDEVRDEHNRQMASLRRIWRDAKIRSPK